MEKQSEITKLKNLRLGIIQFNNSLSTPEWLAADDGAARFLFVLEQRIKALQMTSIKKIPITRGYIESLP